MPPARRRRSNRRKQLPAVALVLLALLAAGAWFAYLELTGHSITSLVDPDKLLVEKYLHENLNDSRWTEVRWWPARLMVEFRQQDINRAKEELAINPQFGEELMERAQKPALRVCRIKYRSREFAGTLILHDNLFVIENARAVKATMNPPYGHVEYAGRQFFPE